MNQPLLKSALCLCLLLSACNNQPGEANKETATTNPAPEKTATMTEPQKETPPAPATTGNTTAPERVVKEEGIVTGRILETMNSAGYTYLLVDTGQAQQWVAIPETTVKVGDEVAYQDGMVMPHFTSQSLNRTFDAIVFSPGLVGQTPATGTRMTGDSPHGHGMPMGKAMTSPHDGAPASDQAPSGAHSFADAVKAESPGAMQAKMESGGSIGAIAPFAEVKVDKATGENGYTVAEIFADTTGLDGKTVRVQGKVVKFNSQIMGKNWIHLQDGSGDPLNNTHDLVITTSAQPPKDKEIITIEGVVRANQDFGAGYRYEVLVEDARIVE